MVKRDAENVRLLVESRASLLPAGPHRTVVVLGAASHHDELLAWLPNFQQDRVHLLSKGGPARPAEAFAQVTHHPASSLAEQDEALRAVGPVDILIDLRHRTVWHYRRAWQRLAFHLRQGGVYVVRPSATREGATVSALAAWAGQLSGIGGPSETGDPVNDAVIAGVVLLPDLFVIVKRGRHYLKVRSSEAEQLLPARDPNIRVDLLAELPSGELNVEVEATSYAAAVPIKGLETHLPYPAMKLRHYRGPITFAGRTLMYSDSSILSDSFRFYASPNLSNPLVREASPSFGVIRRSLRATETLDGDFFVLDPQWTGHFGHIMTEVVARLWGWDEAKRRLPDLKVLYRVKDGLQTDPLIHRLATAYGVPEGDLVAVDHPVALSSVVTATAMWHNYRPHFVHPGVRDIWTRISDNLADKDAPAHERIFVSRPLSGFARTCHNAPEVEALFERHGFAVVRPEELDLSVQAGIFKSARVIAGFGGSAMFNMMYADKLEHMIVVTHEAYGARNEYLYTAVLGGQAHYFWSTPDIPQLVKGYNWRAFVSDWAFDFDRNREPLESLLATL